MALIVKNFTFSAGQTIVASQHNSNFDTIYNAFNGNINTANISPTAGILDTQLATISTAAKVSYSAISYGPSFLVNKGGTNQTAVVSGADTAVTWPTEVFDTNNNFASNTFTPTVAGKYFFTASVDFTVGVDQTEYQLIIRKGTTPSIYDIRQCSGTGKVLLVACGILTANGSTDTFDVHVTQTSGGDKIIDGDTALTRFQGFFFAL